MHYCCRDRNLLGMLSDLLGASAIGLRNLLLITGDPPKMGPYPDATAVFDIDAIGLTNLVSKLNHGLDPGGNAIGAPTSLHDRRRRESRRDRSRARAQALRVEGGSGRRVRDHAAGVRRRAARALPRDDRARADSRSSPASGRCLSLRNAEFLANEVPGVVVPDTSSSGCAARARSQRSTAVPEGIAIAREMLERVRPSVQGVQVSAPFGKVELALEVFRDTLAGVAS